MANVLESKYDDLGRLVMEKYELNTPYIKGGENLVIDKFSYWGDTNTLKFHSREDRRLLEFEEEEYDTNYILRNRKKYDMRSNKLIVDETYNESGLIIVRTLYSKFNDTKIQTFYEYDDQDRLIHEYTEPGFYSKRFGYDENDRLMYHCELDIIGVKRETLITYNEDDSVSSISEWIINADGENKITDPIEFIGHVYGGDVESYPKWFNEFFNNKRLEY